MPTPLPGSAGAAKMRRMANVKLKVVNNYTRIYAVVRRVPKGRVATYGQVAALAGIPGAARLVGYALHALRSGTVVPWHRVVNAQGRLSLGRTVAGGDLAQRRRLEAEGVEFVGGRISLRRFGWKPRRQR